MKKIKILSLTLFVLLIGVLAINFIKPVTIITAENLKSDEQEIVIRAIKKVLPAVVSIAVYDKTDAITIGNTDGTPVKIQKVLKGSGSGFLISADGLILTNKHVASLGGETTAEFKITLNSGKGYYAQLIGKDPVNDLAILKIFDKNLPYIEMGDSAKLPLGTTVMAIGNALGRYQNSVTKGIISGMGRNLAAADSQGNAENLNNVLQTDASINPGNSGGPLINLDGKVVGVNVAVDNSGGSSIGFAIPINDAKPVINSAKTNGRIIRPRLGVRYLMITPEVALEKKLSRETGALILQGENGEAGIVAGSPAEKADLQIGDIIFEVDGVKVDGDVTLSTIMQNRKPGNQIGLKILRGDKTIVKKVILDEFK